MFITGELVMKSYNPKYIEPDMFFSRRMYPGSDKEYVEVWHPQESSQQEDVFIAINGPPVALYIINLEGNILAYPEEIGWFDEGEHTDELHDITLKEINTILQQYEGYLEIDVDDEFVPRYQENKVVIRYQTE